MFCRLGPRDASDRAPGFLFPSSEYAQAVVVLRYPDNLFHGVTPGRHRLARARSARRARDFLSPHPDDFVKDLVIVTLSDAPNAED